MIRQNRKFDRYIEELLKRMLGYKLNNNVYDKYIYTNGVYEKIIINQQ